MFSSNLSQSHTPLRNYKTSTIEYRKQAAEAHNKISSSTSHLEHLQKWSLWFLRVHLPCQQRQVPAAGHPCRGWQGRVHEPNVVSHGVIDFWQRGAEGQVQVRVLPAHVYHRAGA